MIIEQEYIHAIRIGIRQTHFAQHLERRCRKLPRNLV